MKLFSFSLACAFALLASSMASAATVEHTFKVQNATIKRFCKEQVIVTVNGLFPGPTINVHEGDTVIVHVLNDGSYNITLHWHGVFQLSNPWADGPEYVTQCPIRPREKYTYKFNVKRQEGTLWWHAHASYLRATVHGAFIIQPRSGQFPFPKPYKQIPLILGDLYNSNVENIITQAKASGGGANMSCAFTINGLTSGHLTNGLSSDHLINCTGNETFEMKVKHGKTYMLRMINAALNYDLFFKIAHHNFTVVAVDASYTDHYVTDLIVLAPGQSADVLLKASQPRTSYYMVASPYVVGLEQFDTNVARGTLIYESASPSSKPVMPILPPFNDTDTAYNRFYNVLTSKVGAPHWVRVPRKVDQHLFITIGFSLELCDSKNPKNATCKGPSGQRFSASMNNESFAVTTGVNLLEAFYKNIDGVYTRDFPYKPPLMFDFTNMDNAFNMSLLMAPKSTKARKLRFNSTVEILFQNTALLYGGQNHPMHIHGYSFHVLGQGIGNFNENDRANFNLVNPQFRNTVGVPRGGWTVIRFQANNAGIWLVHCHMEDHVPWGLAMIFEVENGPTPSTSVPPPPIDLPIC